MPDRAAITGLRGCDSNELSITSNGIGIPPEGVAEPSHTKWMNYEDVFLEGEMGGFKGKSVTLRNKNRVYEHA